MPFTVGEQWADYLRGVMPRGAPDVQIEECRRAFYAGALSMFHIVSAISASAVDDNTGAARLDTAYREVTDYFRNFQKRHEP